MLGFILNSVSMTVTPTKEKVQSVLAVCHTILKKQKPTIREVAKTLGTIISCFSGNLYGPLNYRQLEKDKTTALITSKGNFDSFMAVSPAAKLEVRWWIDNIAHVFQPLSRENAKRVIKTDASLAVMQLKEKPQNRPRPKLQ
eukprot:gene1657-1846_t